MCVVDKYEIQFITKVRIQLLGEAAALSEHDLYHDPMHGSLDVILHA